ncbi:hypothetical protein BJ165DRAFT_631110 [Panaeolus papilionaceus]|nr:hypothetical protein BJ165DRAFT_631110 [Panaeolus papilionaceus]
MGPTGAGKSSFIEALAGPRHALGKISSGRLEGCTQSVIQYQLTGVEILYSGESWVSLIDTPGFADPKVSEFDIVSLIRKWWGDNEEQYFDQIIYVTPVNSVRLPGSQRALLKTFMKLMGEGGAGMLTIVTTMWDGVWGPQASKRAERNFEQLEKEVWKDFIANGSKIAKFFNTQKSALQILDQVCQMPSKFTNLEYFSRPIHNLPYTDELRDDLRSRVHSLQMQKDILETELVSGVKNKR